MQLEALGRKSRRHHEDLCAALTGAEREQLRDLLGKTMTALFGQSITINASPSIVWHALTRPELMKQWMAEPEIRLEIITNWNVGSTIVTTGFHHVRFENKGTVLEFDPDRVLRYTHLSSISRLPDRPEHYAIIEFRLAPIGRQTSLTLTVSNFATDTIKKHLEFTGEPHSTYSED